MPKQRRPVLNKKTTIDSSESEDDLANVVDDVMNIFGNNTYDSGDGSENLDPCEDNSDTDKTSDDSLFLLCCHPQEWVCWDSTVQRNMDLSAVFQLVSVSWNWDDVNTKCHLLIPLANREIPHLWDGGTYKRSDEKSVNQTWWQKIIQEKQDIVDLTYQANELEEWMFPLINPANSDTGSGWISPSHSVNINVAIEMSILTTS